MPLTEDIQCRKCKRYGYVSYQVVESGDGAYEDYHFTCEACKADWWIDGPDA
jgi:hypothetical protein